jgi:hypothetical protein
MRVYEKKERNERLQIRLDVTIYIFYSRGTKITATVQQRKNSLV